jgi:glyceraldehyde 3-phosphate dehydrogenase
MDGGQRTKIAINGFGRIGRNAFKVAFERSDLEIVAVNDLADSKTLAHLLKHDSNYGAYQHEVDSDDQNIIVEGQKIKVLSEKEPSNLPWKDLGVEVVIESTGLFTDPAKAKAHIEAGAKKVIISAPADGEGAETIVIGVNEDKIETAGDIISNASCTTNAITPVMAVLEANFGIEKAMMTTMHGYTQDQRLQDAPHKDLRRARNAATNIVPTTTGATKAAAKTLPSLEGIFSGLSVRVPIPVVSLSDFAVLTKKNTTIEEVNEAFKKAASEPYFQGILDVTEEELVSSDFIGNSYSAIVDLKLTNVVGGNLVKVVAWYDNEWGYCNRLVELTADVARLLRQDVGYNTKDQKNQKQESNQDPKVEDEDRYYKQDHEVEKESSVMAKTDITKLPDEPLLDAPTEDVDQNEEKPETITVAKQESQKEYPEDSDKTAIGEDTSAAGYIIEEEKPKHSLPPDATNIDGVHRF